ncbi:hypothetical protein GCM10010170_098960 [Dactylosporangium salmoneum]|uniref:Uncharacterized protein n=1 Tax=Dactylosporangium salmoneum TaxID=53361 RepID=A0ABP5UWY2_9ACTN
MQFEDRLVLDLGPEDPFQGGVDLGEQPADAVGQAGGFTGEVVIEADQDLQLGQGLIGDIDAAQRVRQRAGGVGDDIRAAGRRDRSGRPGPAVSARCGRGRLPRAADADHSGRRPCADAKDVEILDAVGCGRCPALVWQPFPAGAETRGAP